MMKRRRIVLSLAVLIGVSAAAAPVSLHCWIVGERQNNAIAYPTTAGEISNMVAVANEIWSQAAMSFEIASISWTNDSRLAYQSIVDSANYNALVDIEQGTAGLELYFVLEVVGAVAFQLPGGMALGATSTGKTLAHEIGHACGLLDIYDQYANETDLVVTGMPSRVRMPYDFGRYPAGVMQTNIIQRMLMYGYDHPAARDISYGDVYGLWYTSRWDAANGVYLKDWQLSLAPVGFHFHGNRHPQSD